MTAETAGVSRIRPGTSSRGFVVPGPDDGASSAMKRAARMRPATQNGTFTQNMKRQLRWVRMAPPTSGPRIGPSRAGSATIVTVRPSALPLAACMISVVRTGSMRPPPAPWTTRQAMSDPAFHARLEPTEPTRKTESANIHSRLPPKRCSPQVLSGTAMPSASR